MAVKLQGPVGERGFSLLELMVASAVGTIFLLGLIGGMVNVRREGAHAERKVDQLNLVGGLRAVLADGHLCRDRFRFDDLRSGEPARLYLGGGRYLASGTKLRDYGLEVHALRMKNVELYKEIRTYECTSPDNPKKWEFTERWNMFDGELRPEPEDGYKYPDFTAKFIIEKSESFIVDLELVTSPLKSTMRFRPMQVARMFVTKHTDRKGRVRFYCQAVNEIKPLSVRPETLFQDFQEQAKKEMDAAIRATASAN